MGGFAWFTVDFEPLPDGRLGFEFVNPRGPEDIDAGRRLSTTHGTPTRQLHGLQPCVAIAERRTGEGSSLSCHGVDIAGQYSTWCRNRGWIHLAR
ncbi:hypothetical protein EES46_14940 [Streptomyces sp. ADI98-10]|nr:hypothetical protein EES46_14940 [Streptomyces sp. ADI98-10]